MAVPKKRTGHSAQGHRRSNWKATKPEVTKCSNCGEVVLTHTVCTACGYYKGKAVSIKSPDYIENAEVKVSAKKAAAKTPAKAKKAEATVESAEILETAVEAKETTEVKTKKAAKPKAEKAEDVKKAKTAKKPKTEE